eukprot:UN05915
MQENSPRELRSRRSSSTSCLKKPQDRASKSIMRSPSKSPGRFKRTCNSIKVLKKSQDLAQMRTRNKLSENCSLT